MSVTPSAPVRRRRARPSRQVVVGVVGALVGLAFALALFRAVGPGTTVSAQVRGYTVESDTLVVVQLEVARPPGTPVQCAVRARGRSGLEVGRREVDLPVATRRSTVEEVRLTTTERAVTGELLACRARGTGGTTAP